jgi:uncharacterized protein (TIGR00297 family)
MLMNLALGLVLSSLMGVGGYYKAALSKSGVLGAIIVGTAIFGFGGWAWGLLLIAFFVSSSFLSALKKMDKARVAEAFDKGGQRDLGQALANGGLGALIALLSLIWPASWWWYAFLGAMGTVNADTWATELGVLSKQPPRLITSGKKVPAGTSGGITAIGTLAALGGGLFIGLVAWGLSRGAGWLSGEPLPGWGGMAIVVTGFGGLAGALFDSLLGATLQTMYVCDTCSRETERTRCCAGPTRHLRGISWLNNDWVNFISAVIGASITLAIGRLLM